MKKIEEFRPRLRAGQIRAESDRTVFEQTDPYAVVTLPVGSAAILNLFNGRQTVSEIIKAISAKTGHARLKDLFLILNKLDRYDCLEESLHTFFTEGNELQFLSRLHSLFRLHGSWSLGSQWGSLSERGNLIFNILCIINIGACLFYFSQVPSLSVTNRFLFIRNSYAIGAVLGFVLVSALISYKNIIKTILLLFKQGFVCGPRLSLSTFAFSFEVDDSSQLLSMTKNQACLYILAVLAAPAWFLLLTLKWFPHVHWQILSLTLITTLLDLNPYVRACWDLPRQHDFPSRLIIN